MSSILERQHARFQADPSDRNAFGAVEESLFVSGDWPALVALYEHRLTAPDLERDARERGRVLYRLGQACADRLREPERAADCYRRALAADPTCRPALTELRRMHVARGQWDVALQIAEAENALEMASDERSSLLTEVGAIWLDRLGEPEQALGHFERALELGSLQPAALEGAARAHRALGHPREAAALWERRAEQGQGRERARARAAAAGLYANELAELGRAAELYRRALTDDPRNPDALEAMTEIAESERQWSLLADLHERRFELASAPERRCAIALAAGRLQRDHLGDLEAARLWLRRAAQQDTRDGEVYRALADIERERGDEGALRDALAKQVAYSHGAAPVSALLELACFHTDAGQDERAVELLQAALLSAPDDTLIVEALSDALARLARYEELVDCLERRASLAASDPATGASVLAELAALHEERLGDPDAARQTYERALQADPSCGEAIRALARLYRKAECWPQLRTLLEHAGRGGPREERPASLCELGALLVERFEDREAAARAFEAALALDPGCAAAHRGRQRLALEGGDDEAILAAFQHEAAVTTERGRLGALVQQISRILEGRRQQSAALGWAQRWIALAPEDPDALRLGARLLEELGEHGQLLALLERLDPLLHSGEQAANRRRMARLHAGQGQTEQAITACRGALEADPADVAALESLVELLENAARPEELARARQRLAELLRGAPQAACLDALAVLLEERLGDLPGAIEALSRLAASGHAPGDVEGRLEALLDRTGRHEELAERLGQRAQQADAATARQLGLRRARVLLEHLSRFDAAVASYREILATDPGCAAAQQGLERSLRAAGDIPGLAAWLAEQAAGHPDPGARDRAALERAGLLDEILGASDEAAEIYRRLSSAAHDPEERDRAAIRLEALLERSGDWSALRQHWEERLGRVGEGEQQRLHARLGRLCRDRLDDPEAAVAHLERAAELAPDRSELWQALAQLHGAAGRTADVVRVLEAELAAAPERDRELEVLQRAAQLCAHELDDAERAQRHYRRIAALDPSDCAAGEFLIRYWEQHGRLDEVASLLERRLSALDASERDASGGWAAQRTSLRLRIAGLRAGALDDPEGAIAVLEPALGEIGPQAAVAEPLADLYQRVGQPEPLIELCRRAAEACEPGTERAAWLSRSGDALRERGADREAAEAYRRALQDQPEADAAKAALRDLYRRLGETEPLADLLEAELADLVGPPEIPVRVELAKLLMGPLARPADALLQLQRVVRLDPGHAEALEKGLELAEHLDRREVVEDLLEAALARALAPSMRATLLTRRGRLRAADPTRAPEAAADYREALSLSPGRGDVRQALRALLEDCDDWPGVLDCLFQEACNAPAQQRAGLFERGAEIAWERISPDAALPWLERLRRQQPRYASVLARIAELHRIAGRPRARLRALEAQIELTPEPLAKRDLHVECARLLEHELGAPGRAATALEQASRLRPRDAEVLRHLDRLYRALGRPRDRARVLEALVEVAAEPERSSLLCDAAALHTGPLAQPERAAALLLRALAGTPAGSALRAELLRTLGDTLRAAGADDAWARCAEQELAALDPEQPVFAERRFELRRELAALYQRSGRLDAALRHLRPLVDAARDGGDVPAEVETALLHGLRTQGNWIELERRLAAFLAERDDASGWLELARLREERLADPAAAALAYRRVLTIEPECLAALRGLRAASERLGDWEEAAQTLEEELEHPELRSAQACSSLLQRLGDVCWERLRSSTRASRAYAAALEAYPENFAAHRKLEQLLEAMEDWRGALDLYESEVAVLGDREPERRQLAWLRAGEIARDHTGQIQRALCAYSNAAGLGELAVARRLEHAELHRLCGDVEAFAEVFASWCDAPEAPARASDHLRLAETLEQLGRLAAALARAERAIQVDPQEAAAWDAAARLHEANRDPESAARAFERAAELALDGGAAERLRRAARLREDADPQRAAELLRRAAECDASSGRVQAALAEVSLGLDRFEEAEQAAARALDLEADAGPPRRLEIALLGAQAARAGGRPESAARFYETALEVAPDHAGALAGAGETLFALGELEAARAALEARLALPAANDAQALHHALLARCLSAAGDAPGALAHCQAALSADPTQPEAHALRVELHEAADQLDAGVAALEAWAEQATASERAARLLRAAAWELRAGGREPAAEAHLRAAIEADVDLAAAWQQLAELLWQQQRLEAALEAADAGLERARDAASRVSLLLVRARALERRGQRDAAAEAFGAAAEADRRCTEAATAQARLLRAAGDWRGAAQALERFAQQHPGDDPAGLALALQQLGRLRAGPLEDLEGAIAVYRRAIELDPEQVELRTMLANLLSQRPADAAEALAHHAAALERDPLHASSLRALLRSARQTGRSRVVADGLALLQALGTASPAEAEAAAPRLSLPIAGGAGLDDPVGERLRGAVQLVAREIGAALAAPAEGPELGPADDALAAFRAAALAAEGRLTAPGLLPLPTAELAEVVSCVAMLALDPESARASGAKLNTLSEALGRRARRRVKRALQGLSLAEIEAIDFASWRCELRALAAATAVDETGCALRTALVALIGEAEDREPREIPPSADLTARVAACPGAASLLRRAVRAWLASF